MQNSLLGGGVGVIPQNQTGALVEMVVEQLRQQFGNAEVRDINGGKYAVVKLTKEDIRNAILAKVEPKIASVSDVDIVNNAVEIRIRLL